MGNSSDASSPPTFTLNSTSPPADIPANSSNNATANSSSYSRSATYNSTSYAGVTSLESASTQSQQQRLSVTQKMGNLNLDNIGRGVGGGGDGGVRGRPPAHNHNRRSVDLSHGILASELTPRTVHILRTDLTDDTTTPRSLEIRRSENSILRMPDSRMMLIAQEDLHNMLEDIHGDAEGFKEYVGGRRGEMEADALVGCREEVNLLNSSLEDFVIGEAVGKGRFSTVFKCRRKVSDARRRDEKRRDEKQRGEK